MVGLTTRRARVLLVLSLALAAAARPAYDQQQTVLGESSTWDADGEEGAYLRRFAVRSAEEMEEVLSAVDKHNLDIWQFAPTHVDVFTPPHIDLPSSFASLPTLHTSRIPSNYTHTPQPASDSQTHETWDLASLKGPFHETYHALPEIDAFLGALAAKYPERVSLMPLGHSAEGREMFAVRISSGEDGDEELVDDGEECVDGDVEEERKKRKHKGKGRKGRKSPAKPKGKQAFVITGAQHAREWVASAAALYVAHALAVDAEEDGSLAPLLEKFDFHIVPVPNPDGYVYTWERDRFWYKNRMLVGPDEPCQGLDMNRNWGFAWSPTAPTMRLNATGAHACGAQVQGQRQRQGADPCSHWYPGHRPFEAPEVNNIANYVMVLPRRAAFVDLRSYGQMVSAPYSYSCAALPPDAENLFEAAYGIAYAVRKRHGTSYTTGRLCSSLYAAPGNILDWMYGAAGVPFAYAAHLRDTGTYGYALPPDWIRPVGEETATMVASLTRFIERLWQL